MQSCPYVNIFDLHTGQCMNYHVHHLHTSCSAVMCLDPPAIVNGMRTFTGNSVGDTATYTCDSGFELIGGATATCTEVDVNTAEFTPVPPVCSSEYTAMKWLHAFSVVQMTIRRTIVERILTVNACTHTFLQSQC